MQIAIKCKAGLELSYNQLNDFQGDLKDLSEENYQRLKKEIATTGFAFAPHAWANPSDKQWYLIDGHQRVRTIRRMVEQDGFDCPRLPVVPVDASSYQEAKRRVLQGTSQYGHVTEEGLKKFIIDANFNIDDIEMSFDFPHVELPSFVKEHFKSQPSNEADDEVPAAPAVSKVKPGDLFFLGPQRLLCGDSTSIDSVNRLMGVEKADMVFTSPPYNCGIKYSQYDDKKEREDYLIFIKKIISVCFATMKQGRSIFWNCGSSMKSHAHAHAHAHALEENGFVLLRQIIWKKVGVNIPLWQNTKKNPVARNYSPNYVHENIFFAAKGKLEHGMMTSHDDKLSNDIWEISQFSAGGNSHPAAFPVELVELPILSMTNVDEFVFDPFGGSGSTLIACEKTKRKCFMMEIDSNYCHVILDRWAVFTGKDPVREDGKKWSEIKAL